MQSKYKYFDDKEIYIIKLFETQNKLEHLYKLYKASTYEFQVDFRHKL